MSKKRYILFFCAIVLLAAALRFYRLSSTPPGLYWDEVSIGYNAYSILLTGKDEFGESYPLIFKAFGEFKLPIYIYTTAASIALFGITDFAIRFPSALAGSLSVAMIIILVAEMYPRKRRSILPLLAGFFLAISPWHIQFSHAGFEANLALLFVISALVAFLQGLRGRRYGLVISVIVFLLAFNTYNSARVFVPLLIGAITLIYRKQLKGRGKEITLALIIGTLGLLPVLPQFISGEALIRARSESIFNRENAMSEMMKNYLSNFDTTFLFFRGDQNGRHSVRKLGMLYVFELPLIVIGLGQVLKNSKDNKQGKRLLISWLLLAPMPTSLTTINPHAIRSLNIMPAWHILTAIGLVKIIEQLKKYKIHLRYMFAVITSLLIMYNITLYLHQYYVHYPTVTALDWQDGLKETVQIISSRFDEFDDIYISDTLPPIYIGYYLPVKPWLYQQMNTDESIGKLHYFKHAWEVEKSESSKVLFIAPHWQKPTEGTPFQEVKMINGDTVFTIWQED